VSKSHLILVPKYATLADIATLKNDAYRAKDEGDIDLAKQLWIRVNAAAFGQDMEAITAIERIAVMRHYPPTWISAGRSRTEEGEGESKPLTEYELQVFQF
ncbi:MAG: SUMF1/EgtB/PvdO family nonheme iron enzyme, partial [Nostoc sp.]